eukprot:1185502-Prorocentrum_minimum.AAC.3
MNSFYEKLIDAHRPVWAFGDSPTKRATRTMIHLAVVLCEDVACPPHVVVKLNLALFVRRVRVQVFRRAPPSVEFS